MKNNTQQEFNDSLDLLSRLFINKPVHANESRVYINDSDGDVILAFNSRVLTTVATELTANQLECISDLMKIMYKLN